MSDPFNDPNASPWQSGWQQPPPSGQQPDAGSQDWTQQDGSGQWGQQPQWGDQSGSGQQPHGGDQSGWGQQPQWGDQSGWGQQPPGQPPAFGQPGQPGQWGPQPYTQPSSSGNRVLVIVLAVVAVVILGIVGAAVAIFNAASDGVGDFVEGFDGGGIPEGVRLLDTGGFVPDDGSTRFDFVVGDSTEVQIDVIGRNGFDPVITLFGPDGARLQEDDDGGSGFDSRIRRQLSSGTYTVEIRGFAGDSGDFDIIVTDL